MSSERLPSVNRRPATSLEDVVSSSGSTLVVITGVEGWAEFLRDWGKRSENSKDNIFAGARLSTSAVEAIEQKVK